MQDESESSVHTFPLSSRNSVFADSCVFFHSPHNFGDAMEFTINHQPSFSTLRIGFHRGETFRAEAGAMLAMTPSIELEAKSAGKGFLGTLKAAVGGESFFASLFTAKDEGEVLLAPATQGDIIQLEMRGNVILCEGGAYLAGHPDLEISTQGSFRAMIAGEGLFLQRITGQGPVFLSAYGAIIKKTLGEGERYIVDTGHMVAFDGTMHHQIRKVSRGLFSTLASGEGLVVEFTGPGTVWMQTRNISAFAKLLERLLPNRS